MFEYISPVLMLFLLSAMTINVQAGSVHKWVDAQGVTHYSDQLPKSLASTNYDAVKQIDVLDSYSNSSRYSENQDDYYSISNQWARMKEERLERKQLQLEKAKLKERQKAVAPQIVYVNQAKDDRSRNIYYPAYQNRFAYRGYGRGLNRTFNSTARRNGASFRRSNSNFSRGHSSFGSSRFNSSRSHRSRSLGSGLTLRIR